MSYLVVRTMLGTSSSKVHTNTMADLLNLEFHDIYIYIYARLEVLVRGVQCIYILKMTAARTTEMGHVM